jgi:hypothetical protein
MVIVSKNALRISIRTAPRVVASQEEVFAIMPPKRQNVHGDRLKRYELI